MNIEASKDWFYNLKLYRKLARLRLVLWQQYLHILRSNYNYKLDAYALGSRNI
ncbi:hypothetical protein SAMN04487979_107153 [Flavobacterium sp. ov086]|nr:hypothetical protein SAMN04487979_107153 [Flavobacterium sp. ov086]